MKQAIFKHWRTTMVGVAAVVLAAFRASQAETLTAAIHDPHFQLLVVVGVLGMIAKDGATQ